MKKRYFLLCGGLVILIALLSCCGKKAKEDPPPETDPVAHDEKGIILFDAAGAHCRIAYPNEAGETVVSLAQTLGEAFRELTGAEIPICREADVPDDGAAVLWLGNTWAGWEAGLATGCGYYGYTVRPLNGDLYLFSLNDKVLSDAVIKCGIRWESAFSGGVLRITPEFAFGGSPSKYTLLGNIPYFEGADYRSTHDCDNGHEMILFANATAETFNAYCEKIVSNGFRQTAGNDWNGNLFRTFFNDAGVMLHTYLTAYSGEVRVIVADRPAYRSEPTGTVAQTWEPFLYPLSADGGMGYVLRLADGSFLVVDGGYRNANCRDQLYDVLAANAPDPDHIVIACWILTHGHVDHVGTFLNFAETCRDDPKIEIRSFLQNMCLTDEQCQYLQTDLWQETLSCMALNYPSVPVYVALTGQVYDFAGTKVEILYTMPDYMPRRLDPNPEPTPEKYYTADGNTQSVVFRVTVNGHTLLFMADTTSDCCDEMCARYGSWLKSEYVQMAHHGIADERPHAQNATKEIYELIAPTYALLPCSKGQMAGKLANEVNQYLLSIIGGESRVICSGSWKKLILFPAS